MIGLLLAAWTAMAGWFMLKASARTRGTELTRRSVRRSSSALPPPAKRPCKQWRCGQCTYWAALATITASQSNVTTTVFPDN